MEKEKEYPIKSEWTEYYQTLERIRQSGIVNMWGSSPYLAAICGIDDKLAQDILVNWIYNYSELEKRGIIKRED